MATIKNGTFKDLTGSFGNSYLRVRNGKQEVCAKPGSYTLSMEERPVAIRSQMSRLAFISKEVTTDDFFYDLWKIKEIKGAGPYNKFISRNHFGKKNTLDLSLIKLSPYDNYFEAEIDTFQISEHLIQIKIKPLGDAAGINKLREPFIVSRGILLCTGNLNSVKDMPLSYKLNSKPIPTEIENPIELTFNRSFISAFGNYTELRVLLILATLDSVERLVKTSVTMSCYINPEG